MISIGQNYVNGTLQARNTHILLLKEGWTDMAHSLLGRKLTPLFVWQQSIPQSGLLETH